MPEAKRLDEKGRCCGRKPMIYKMRQMRYCPRCDRSYDLDTGEQIESWSWKRDGNGFVPSALNREKGDG